MNNHHPLNTPDIHVAIMFYKIHNILFGYVVEIYLDMHLAKKASSIKLTILPNLMLT